ncbi:MAG: metallopeptidase [Candidatus Aenigmarchaeota archaeon]|nr:metallopeptidase [Candidatus Aenigmarchaeota archaeon]
MGISYHPAPDIQKRALHVTIRLSLQHIDLSRVAFVRSKGSKSRRTLARCHALSRIFQKALGIKAHYVIEVISEHFDRLSYDDQTRTIIHELLHIPASMGGGFRHHKPYVNRRIVEKFYKEYIIGD